MQSMRVQQQQQRPRATRSSSSSSRSSMRVRCAAVATQKQTLSFKKYQGLGNDFILVSSVGGRLGWAARWGRRSRGGTRMRRRRRRRRRCARRCCCCCCCCCCAAAASVRAACALPPQTRPCQHCTRPPQNAKLPPKQVDNRGSPEPVLTPEQAARLCDRNFGVGGDGVIFALPAVGDTDLTMRIYNSDGSEPEMCGNGIRCLARFVADVDGAAARKYRIHTLAGESEKQRGG